MQVLSYGGAADTSPASFLQAIFPTPGGMMLTNLSTDSYATPVEQRGSVQLLCVDASGEAINGSVLLVTTKPWIIGQSLASHLSLERQSLGDSAESKITGLFASNVTDLTLYEDDDYAYFVRQDGSTHCGSKVSGGVVSSANRLVMRVLV
eukprot:m.124167 g.124167  ORF g.124167 m.124167 type:complete len:150 (+) comp15695_c0_seq1:3338-3787(+)